MVAVLGGSACPPLTPTVRTLASLPISPLRIRSATWMLTGSVGIW